MKIFLQIIFIIIINNTFCSENNIQLGKIKLPDGFKIEIFAKNIVTARGLAVSPAGIVFVGSKNGNVYAIVYDKDNFKTSKIYIIAKNLKMPVGVAFYKGSLYVSEINRILRFNNIETRLKNPPAYVVVNNSFPANRWHGWKFIKFGPDDKLYVPVGAPCNVCNKENEDKRFATIMRMNPDGSNLEIYATGIRNTVGFDWNPLTNELWFTDNGRDNMGDNIPPDELNYAPKKGLHFGFPFVHGKKILDPEFGKNKNISDYTQPAMELGPHVAALGMRFYTGDMFPVKYRDQIFIAEHGSWNRSIPIGYRITLVSVNNNKATDYQVFAEGWLINNKDSWGRPVDIENLPDGSILVSDDKANAVYRIFYNKK